MRMLFFGTPDFAVPSLKALLEAGYDIISVITQPDRVKGRGHRLSSPAIKEFAVLNGIPVIQPVTIRKTEFTEEISALKPDVIVVVAYGKIIPLSILEIPRIGCVNVHASLLPAYRGAAPIQWALMNGEKRTGVTTMLMDEGLDTGDILLKEELEIIDEDNALTLAGRLSVLGASLLLKTLRGLENDSVSPVAQSGEPTYAPPLRKEDGRINWSLPAKRISDIIRGTYPWPGAYCFLKHQKLNVLKAKSVSAESTASAGCVIDVGDKEILIGTGKGILAVSEVKPEGKKSMSATAFAHGKHLKPGSCFEIL
jgi:methionyl-tRNA formyltransferase